MFREIPLPLPLISASMFLIKLPVFRKNIFRILLQKSLSATISPVSLNSRSIVFPSGQKARESGLISVSHCGQEVLKRTACEITDKEITARFYRLSCNGRTINSIELEKILFEFLPVCIKNTFFLKNLNADRLREAVFLAEDQTFIREQLKIRSLAAFVADGSILPRESGVSSRPMKNSIPFQSPDSSARFHGTSPQRNHNRYGNPSGDHFDREAAITANPRFLMLLSAGRL